MKQGCRYIVNCIVQQRLRSMQLLDPRLIRAVRVKSSESETRTLQYTCCSKDRVISRSRSKFLAQTTKTACLIAIALLYCDCMMMATACSKLDQTKARTRLWMLDTPEQGTRGRRKAPLIRQKCCDTNIASLQYKKLQHVMTSTIMML